MAGISEEATYKLIFPEKTFPSMFFKPSALNKKSLAFCLPSEKAITPNLNNFFGNIGINKPSQPDETLFGN